MNDIQIYNTSVLFKNLRQNLQLRGPGKMALRKFPLVVPPFGRNFGIENWNFKRNFADDPSIACKKGVQMMKKEKDTETKVDPCDGKICNKKPKKEPFWRRFLKGKEEKPLPPVECCKIRQKPRCDPDLSEFGGKAYRTCGPAYIIQKDILSCDEPETGKEELILKRMEACLEFKDVVNEDPMPKFKNAEMRMLEMSDKRLHPAYKKYCNVKKMHVEAEKKKIYKMISWPIDMHEIPARFNIKKDLLEKKNMEYVEFKRIEPPRQLIERAVEMERNARPTMEKTGKTPVDMKEVEKRQEAETGAVFDTLHQPETKF